MAVNAFQANQGTQSNLLTDNTGGASGTLIPVMKLSTDGQGTFTTGGIWNGNVGVSSGTINNIAGGTVVIQGNIGSGGVFNNSVNPVLIAGEDYGLGTNAVISPLKVNNSGQIFDDVIDRSTRVLGSITGGSIVVTAGTVVMTSGTLNVGTAVMPSGTLNVGTINTGTINLGTITGKDANAVAQTSNPLAVGGTDSGGTVRTVLVDSTGAMKVSGASAGTFVNLTTGTLNAGTINLGTVVGKDANAAAQTGNPIAIGGTDSGGTVRTVLVNSAGAMSVSGASSGTFNNISTGTMQTLGTVGTVQNILAGTISGLQNGTITTGTINTGTVNLGSMVKITPAATAGSFTAAGTITTAGSQQDLSYYDLQGTWVGTIFFEGQIGTSSWFGVNAMTPTGVIGTQTTGNGDYMVPMAGLDGVRARLTYSSGTVTYNNRTSNFFAPLHYSLGGSLGNIGTLGAGTVTMTTGTIAAGTINSGTFNLNSGTINAGTINTGTINSGTINVGTVQINPLTATNTISHAGTSGTLGIGTLVGTASIGAGTALYPTSFHILAISGTPEVCLAFGSVTNGNQVIAHGLFPAGGGIAKDIAYPHGYGTTNSPLTFQIISGAGTVAWDVNYFIHT